MLIPTYIIRYIGSVRASTEYDETILFIFDNRCVLLSTVMYEIEGQFFHFLCLKRISRDLHFGLHRRNSNGTEQRQGRKKNEAAQNLRRIAQKR